MLDEPTDGIMRPMTGTHEAHAMTADRSGLGVLGFIFGGVTAAVMLVAATVTIGHIEGRLSLETTTVLAEAPLSVQRN
jgi:F420-0:gamma-glutamyl ligase-like protein